MGIIRLSISKILSRPLNAAVSIILFGIGIGIISLVITVEKSVRSQFLKNLAGVDLVVGAKGSPLQLILSSVFHLDTPTGNISLQEAEQIAKNPLVKRSVPISLGDNYHGFRIVGTTTDYPALYNATLSSGTWFHAAFEAVAGAEAARKTGLTTGDQFTGRHGFTGQGHHHDQDIYTLKGVLQPTGTVLDELILTTIDTYWHIHGNHPEFTGMQQPFQSGETVQAHMLTSAENKMGYQDQGYPHDHDTGEDCTHDHDTGEDCTHRHSTGESCTHDPDTSGEHTIRQTASSTGNQGSAHTHTEKDTDIHPGGSGEDQNEAGLFSPRANEIHDLGTGMEEEAAWQELIAKLDAREDLSAEEMAIYRARTGQMAGAITDQGKEITALLVFYSTPRAAVQLPRMINDNTTMQAASPAFETHRLFSLAGQGISALRWLAWIIIAISGLNLFIHLSNTLNQRLPEIALIRSLGASRAKVMALLMLQGLWLSIAGWLAGIILSGIIMTFIPVTGGLPVGTILVFSLHNLWLLGVATAAGLLASLPPAIKAYRSDIHHILNNL